MENNIQRLVMNGESYSRLNQQDKNDYDTIVNTLNNRLNGGVTIFFIVKRGEYIYKAFFKTVKDVTTYYKAFVAFDKDGLNSADVMVIERKEAIAVTALLNDLTELYKMYKSPGNDL